MMLFVAISVILLQAAAQSPFDEYSSVGTGSGPYVPDNTPGRVSVALFEDANRTPNATHSISFNGFGAFYNTSSGGTVQDWSWRVNVTNVPVGVDSIVTNSVHSLSLPAVPSPVEGISVLSNASSTRGLCAYTFLNLPSNLTDITIQNDGSCQESLGKSCVSQLLDYISSLRSDETGGMCPTFNQLSATDAAPACVEQGLLPASVTAFDLLGLTTMGYPSDTGYFYSAVQHSADDTEAFRNATAAVNVMLLVATSLESSGGDDVAASGVSGARALCQRVDTSAHLADVPGMGPRTSSAHALAMTGLALFVIAIFL